MAKVDLVMMGPFCRLEERLEALELSIFGKNSSTNKLQILTDKMANFEGALHK